MYIALFREAHKVTGSRDAILFCPRASARNTFPLHRLAPAGADAVSDLRFGGPFVACFSTHRVAERDVEQDCVTMLRMNATFLRMIRSIVSKAHQSRKHPTTPRAPTRPAFLAKT